MKKFIALLLFSAIALGAAEKLEVNFSRGKWDQNIFQFVKSPRFKMNGAIIQQDDHIVNKVPANLTERQLLSCPDAYCALLTKKKFSGNITVSSKMSFDHLMAPETQFFLLAFALNIEKLCNRTKKGRIGLDLFTLNAS